MKRYLAIPLLAFAIAGASCDNGKISPAESVLLGCESYSETLGQLLKPRQEGKLSAAVIKIIDDTRDTVDPICLGAPPAIDTKLRDVLVDNGARALITIVSKL